jgi:predicted dehydrogenase
MTFGVGVVGTGAVAQLHLAALRKTPNARLVGVADVVPDRARSAAIAYSKDVRWSGSAAELFAWPEVDGVIVCTPNRTHAEVVAQALTAGKHVLVEKPLALDLASADRLVRAAESSGLVLMPGHTHRFYDYGRQIKEWLDAGRLGNPRYVRLSISTGWIWGGWGSWVIDPAESGGHLLHNGVHMLDLVTWWLGADPVQVMARGQKLTSSHLQIWDYFHVVIGYAGGAAAVVEFSRGSRPRGGVERSLTVAGDAGFLTMPADGWGGILRTDEGTSPLGFDGQQGFDREVAAWVQAAAHREPSPVKPQDGRRAVQLALAAEASITAARPVRVDS